MPESARACLPFLHGVSPRPQDHQCLLGCRDSNGKLRLGDVIVGIDGKEVKLQRDLFEQLDERRPGDKITVDVVRDGDKSNMVSIQVELGSRELAGPAD